MRTYGSANVAKRDGFTHIEVSSGVAGVFFCRLELVLALPTDSIPRFSLVGSAEIWLEFLSFVSASFGSGLTVGGASARLGESTFASCLSSLT